MTTKAELTEGLKKVEDPELGVNIVDLGLVYAMEWSEEAGEVYIDLTLTSPGCPLGPEIIRDIKQTLGGIDGVKGVDVELVWSPLWNPKMMSDEAKEELGYDDEFGLGFL
ncbi:MAG TPA: metal-sulfur cluster assembly factor [Anaerolineae bacterium]|jgi:metal-sulfur cluster biosynthetic enzyme|nr:metal-sulfur cluster assembly factor [Anaerolineae bacterium]